MIEILRKNQIINSKIRVCVECGSTNVSQNLTYLKCVDCGVIGYFWSKINPITVIV